MKMSLDGSQLAVLMCSFICVVSLSGSVCYATSTDVYCLKTLKESLKDPLNYLSSSWIFSSNATEGFICKFAGIECWHPNENRVLNIRLMDMGLKGQFPRGLENCTTMTGLDLSSNNLSGPIPADICSRLGYLTSLDLSSNNFSGGIPLGLGGCKFLNSLKLDNNRLTGKIPPQIGQLDRLKTFSIANNLLSGQIPHFYTSFPVDNFANNPGLCGDPLDPCQGPPRKSHVGIIVGTAVGAAVFFAIVMGVILYYFSSKAVLRKKVDDPEGNKWAMTIKGMKDIKVSMFEKSAAKMRLSDLMKATDNFNRSNIIGSGRTGTMYKGLLPDGYCLMVKRLQDSQQSEKEFVSEMNTLGSVKNQNLVPLLGFCVAKKERLLVYKYMANGSLHNRLHLVQPDREAMDWPQRLRIGLGAARGLAWLHHSCNPRIIHRNISTNCILLDEDLEPKLSDFGLARLMNPVDTHLSTFVNGEFGDLGYVAPEYPRTLVATPKGDVYSFGVVLLELITGQKPTHIAAADEDFKGSLAEWALHLSTQSLIQNAIDKALLGKGFDGELNQFLRVACNCISLNPKERPTMFEVYQLLRAVGERYHFKADDEILVPSETGEADFPDELIVAQEK